MPDVYYTDFGSGSGTFYSLHAGSRMTGTSPYYNMQQARQALNNNYPAVVTAYATFIYKTSGAATAFYVTSPDVDGPQTTDTVGVAATSASWVWAGNVSARYPTTPNVFNAAIQNQSGDLQVAFNTNIGASSNVKYSGGTEGGGRTSTGQSIWFAYHYQQVASAPQNLRAFASSGNYGSIDLYWDSPADWGDGDPLGYSLFRDGQYWGNLGLVNNYTMTGLNPNQGYTFSVCARNNVSEYYGTSSVGSNNASAGASGLLSNVYDLAAYQNANNAGQVDLYWSQPGGGSGSTFINYEVWIQGEGSPRATTSNRNFSVTGLNNWQSYNFFIVAKNQFGAGPAGNVATATAGGVPSAPYNITATPSSTTSGRVTINWAQPAQTSGGITKYTIFMYGDKNITTTVAGNVQTATISSLTPGVQYNFDIRAYNQWGENNGTPGEYSGNTYFTAAGSSTAPQSFTATASTATIGQVDLTWAAPASTGGGSIQFYNIYVDTFTLLASVAGNVLNYAATGISTGNNHQFNVTARNSWNVANGTIGTPTPPLYVTPPPVPTAPQNLGAVASITTAGLISLSWTAPTRAGSGGITRYTIYRVDGNGANLEAPRDVSGTTLAYDWITTPKTVSNFYVVAWNAAADASTTPKTSSPPSNTVSITSNGGAAAPSSLTLTPGTTTIGRLTLTWLPPAGTIVSYVVTRNDGVQTSLKGQKFVDDTVIPGTVYSYTIYAINSTGVPGQASDPISATANTTSTQGVANLTVANNTNTDLSGDFTISSAPSGASFTYRQTTPALTQTAVPTGFGTLIDTTNVFLNGTYFGNVSPATPSLVTIAKSGTPFASTPVPNGTLTDNTNVALSGTGKVVTAINPALKSFSYAATYANTTQRSAGGTVIDTTNEVFNNNGAPVTITSLTDNTFTYPLTANNVAETTATGTATDITNQYYFNGHYNVSAVPGPNVVQYARVPTNKRVNVTNLVRNPRMETAGAAYTYRTNRCTNPSMEVDVAGWTPGSAVTAIRSTSFAYVGTASMLVTKSALTDTNSGVGMTLTGLTSGNVYTISGYFRSGNGDAKPYFSVSGRSSSNPITLTSTWQRTSYTFTANATSHTFYIQSGAATVATSNFYVDALLIEESPLVGTYFDGTVTNTDDFSFSWAGTAHASNSIQTAVGVSGVSFLADGTTAKNWAKGFRSTSWAVDSTHSLALVNRGTHDDQFVDISGMVTLQANKTYTFRATIKTMDSVINPQQIRLQVQNSGGSPSVVYSNYVGTPGVIEFVGTFNTTGYTAGDYIRLYNQVNNSGSTVYWDQLMILEGSYTDIPYFSGATPGEALTYYTWTGTADNSTTTRVTDLNAYVGEIRAPYGGIQRSDNPAAMDVFYRSGWLG